MKPFKRLLISTTIASAFLTISPLQAQVLPEASLGIKIPLAKKPTTRPMTVAYVPGLRHYYIADGGLAPMGSEFEAPVSKSQIHAYDDSGKYVNSAKPGYDNRSIYYNPNTDKLETIPTTFLARLALVPIPACIQLT